MIAAHKTPKNHTSARHVSSKYQQTGVDAGTHTIQIIEILLAQWSKKELKVDEDIEASVDVMGIPDGKSMTFTFYERNSNTPDRILGETKASVSGSKAKTTWKYPQSKVHKFAAADAYFSPTLFFRVSYGSHSGQSDQIPLNAVLTIKLQKEDGAAVSDEPVEARLSNGLIAPAKTDSSGIAVFKKVPPSPQRIRFPQAPNAESADVKEVDLFNPSPNKTAVPQGDKANLFQLVTLYFYCLHKTEGKRRAVVNTTLFEVVPEFKGEDAYKDEVVILSKVPRTLKAKEEELEKLPNEFGMHAYSLKCKQDFDGLVPEIWNVQFWKGLGSPKEYTVSGLPRPLTVNCYRPDIFKLQIKFPAMRKWSGGLKQAGEAKKVISDVKDKKNPSYSDFSYEKAKTGWHLNKWPRPMTSEAPIILQRNDQQIAVDFLKSVGAVVELANKISCVIAAVQENVPKAGWYFEWDSQFFQGTFVMEWGWKEYKDHRAYYYVGFNVDIKLISLKLEIGVGVSGFSCKLQVFGSLSGAVSISVKGCRASPEGDAVISLPFGAEIVGALGARFELGFLVQIEGTVETSLKLNDGEFKFIAKDGLSLACTLQWTGIKVKLKVSAGLGKKEGSEEMGSESGHKSGGREFKEQGSSEKEHELIGPVDLAKWQWPDEKFQYNPPIIPRKELHDLLVKKLTDGANIRVKTGESWGTNDYMAMSDVAQHIEDYIHVRKDLRLDPKTAEALVFDLRSYLEALIYQHPEESGLPHMSYARFQQFLTQGELKSLLKKYVDPMKEIITKNTGAGHK